jgi:hypothetical protein
VLRHWFTLIALSGATIVGCKKPVALAKLPGPPIAPSQPSLSALLPQPVTVPDAYLGKPIWLQPAAGDATRPLRKKLSEDRGERAGRDGALIDTAAGWFWADRAVDGRVHGPLKLPSGARWAGVIDHGGHDAIIGAMSDGRVLVATSIADAKRGRFSERGKLPGFGASRWDAAAQFVVAARDDEVFVSSDGGERFIRSRPRRDAVVTNLLVRYDGVIVAQTSGSTTWISKAGAHWARSAYQPKGVERIGARIRDTGGCGISLSIDGRTWLDPTTPTGDETRDLAAKLSRLDPDLAAAMWEAPVTWASAIYLSSSPWPSRVPDLHRVDTPPPVDHPPPKRRASGNAKSCTRAGGSVLGTLGGGGLRGVGSSCNLARCLPTALGDKPHPTVLSYYALGDSYCTGADRCTRNATLLRSPTLSVLDARSNVVRLVTPPKGCALESVLSASGIGIALCRVDSRTRRVFTIDRSGKLYHEVDTNLGGADPSVRMAIDGTLLITTGDRSWVRAPLPLGSVGAWRSVSMTGAHAYLPLPGGVALVVRSDRVDGSDLVLYLDRPAAAAEHLVTAGVHEHLLELDVVDQRVILTTHPTSRFRPARDSTQTALIHRWTLLSDGGLAPL